MKVEEPEPEINTALYYRLIALWVVCEAFAGGIMHAFQVPFTGMIVSGLSVTCIVLIAWYIPGKLVISKACFIVIIFKLMLSPHSPPTAYVAVFFQGMLGQILFSSKKYFKTKAIMLGLLSLVESAVQRLLILLIVYGNNFWQAVDEFLQKTFKQQTSTGYVNWIAWGYIIIHGIMGIAVGVTAFNIAKNALTWKKYALNKDNIETASPKKERKQSFYFKPLMILIVLILAMLLLDSILYPGDSILSSNQVLQIFLRAVLIILGWFFILSPLLLRMLQKILTGKKKKLNEQFLQVQKILPEIKLIFSHSLAASKSYSGIKRIKLFIKILLGSILNP
ncbi:MAG: hypothetical protein ABIW38_11505 [Ferruginibacter sp.]